MEAISNAILLSPDSYRYLNSRGSICNHEEKYEAAIEDISRALELNPSYPTGWANLACSQRELGQLDQAVQSFSKAIDYQTDPALISSYLCDRASCNLLMNNDESAINDYLEGLNLYPGSPANYADLGWLLIEAERYGEAVSAYSAALELAGDNANYLCERAFASYHLGDNSPVIEDLAAAYSIDQDVFTSDRYDLLGRVYAEEDQMAMAAESFSMALELETDPLNRAWLLSSRGKCYYYLGDYQSSLMDQAAAVELNPSEPFFHFKYAEDCYMLNLDEEAVTHFTQAIELGLPMEYTSECLFQRGRIYLDNEIFEEAIQDFTILMEADSSYPDAFFFRGIAFFYIDETELCRSDMARYLELGSNPGYREDAAGIMELTE
jgi:tetratricopeptide (TPR) repeat protein